MLTPQAIDPAHPFPFIPNRGLSLIFELKKARTVVRELLMAPASLPRFIRLPGDEARYIALETLIRRKTDYLFPKYHVLRGGAFRVLRDSDIEIEEEAEDLVRYFRTAIKRRRRGRVVRLELEPDMPDSLVQAVLQGLDAASAITSATRGFLGMSDLSQLVEEDRPDLKFRRPSIRASPNACASMAATASPRSRKRTSSSTTPTRASRWWSSSSSRPPPTPTWSRSSRRCTARASNRRSSGR